MTRQKPRCVSDLDEEIGFRIRQIRQNKKLSQTEVAKQCGFTYQQLQKYELGRNRISAPRLIQIADALKVDAGDLLKPANDRTPAPLKSRSLQNLDQTAASLWGKIRDDKHRHVIVELMEILHHMAHIQPPDTRNRR